MDKRQALILYAKIGYFFAFCDGEFDEAEEEKLLGKITVLKAKEEYKAVCDETIDQEIASFKDKRTTINELIEDVKSLVSSDSEEDGKAQIADYTKFIEGIIKADGKVDDVEKANFNKWYSAFYGNVQNLPVPAEIDYTIGDSEPVKEKKVKEKKVKEKRPKKEKSKFKQVVFTTFFSLLLLVIGASAIKMVLTDKRKKELANFPISEYTKKSLQFKEIDFSKVLIYGTESDDPDKDSMLLYFVKGTATLRFAGLDNIAIDYDGTDFRNKDLHLIYDASANKYTLPVEVEISFDENKCRFIDNINASPMSTGAFGSIIEITSTVAGTAAGGVVGNMVGGLFGMKGKIIGTAVGAALGGAGSYILSSNFCSKTKIISDNTAGNITDLLEEAKPIIAAQLLCDETFEKGNESTYDELRMKKYFQQKIADTLTDIICTENSEWQTVSIDFLDVVNGTNGD